MGFDGKKEIKILTPMKETKLLSEIVSQEIKIITNYLSYPFSIHSKFLPFGPSQIVSIDDEIAANKVINEIINDFNRDDNILLNCTADIGLEILNQRVERVVGIGSAGFKKAFRIEDNLSIIVPTKDYVIGIKAQVKNMGIDKKVQGIFSLDIAPSEFFNNIDATVNHVINIVEDNSLEDLGSILFGCGTMLLFYNNLKNEKFFQKIVEPTLAGITELESKIIGNTQF